MLINDIIELAGKRGVVKASDLREIGASRTLLPYMERKVILRRIARGSYTLRDYIPEHLHFLEAASAVPRGVICLLSALQFHEITTQMPDKVWMAIRRGQRVPAPGKIPVHTVKFSGQAFHEGIEEHKKEGVIIRAYSPAKTVADCFKFRSRIGLDVAREALIDSLKQKKATRDEIWRYSKICRVSKIILPYLEMAV